MANLTNAALTGIYQNALSYPATTTQSSGYGQQVTYAYPPDPPTRKQEFTILNEGTQDGVFLRAKDGKLHYVPIEKIAVAIGLDW